MTALCAKHGESWKQPRQMIIQCWWWSRIWEKNCSWDIQCKNMWINKFRTLNAPTVAHTFKNFVSGFPQPMGGKLITGQETLIHSIYQHQCKYKLPCQSLMRPVLTNDLNSLISSIVFFWYFFFVNHHQHFSVWGWPLDLDSSTYAQIFPKVFKITFHDAIFSQRFS